MMFDMAGLATVNAQVLPEPPQVIASSIIAKVVIPGEPMSKQRPRFVRKTGAVFTPRETRDRERMIGQYIWAHGWRRPPDMELAFGVRAVFYVSNQQRKDVDNMLKLLLDGLNEVVWADDSQVFEVMGWKREDAANPRTEVAVYSLGFAAKTLAACEQCGKRYRSYPSWKLRQFCSVKCRDAHARTGELVRCGKCETYIYRAKATIDRNRRGSFYCSPECLSLALSVELTCAQCGVSFRRPQSLNRSKTPCCSTACSAIRRNANRRSKRRGDCEVCGGPVSRREYTRCILHRHQDADLPTAEVRPGVRQTELTLEAL